MTPGRIDIYLQVLADLNPAMLCLALEEALNTCSWFPKIPEIRELVYSSGNRPKPYVRTSPPVEDEDTAEARKKFFALVSETAARKAM